MCNPHLVSFSKKLWCLCRMKHHHRSSTLGYNRNSTALILSNSPTILTFLATATYCGCGSHTAGTNRLLENVTPLPMNAVDRVNDCDLGPIEGKSEHIQLEKQQGIPCRTILSELLFAYVCARPDIIYFVTKLSKFSKCPAAVQHHYLKGIAKYLRRTI
jgi:hypothetical protein